jgi:hypothetical protein
MLFVFFEVQILSSQKTLMEFQSTSLQLLSSPSNIMVKAVHFMMEFVVGKGSTTDVPVRPMIQRALQ